MKFNIKKFKKNIPFFIISCIVIMIILVLSLIENNKTLPEEDLNSGDVNVKSLVLNEIMTSNKGAYVDEEGNLYDYVEIYNGEEESINLKGYGLSDEAEVKYTFPDVTIESKGYIVVFLSGTRGNLHAPFKLKSSGSETLALFKPNGKIIDAVETVSLKKNTVMARNTDGKWVVQNTITPGFANTKEGHEEFINSLKKETSNLIVNEIMPNNKGVFKNKTYNDYSGYVEIKNISDETINLKGYSLSDDVNAMYKWQFPDISIKSNEVLVVFTSGKEKEGSELHASFKLASNAGTLIIASNDGKIETLYDYENIPSGMANIYENGNYLLGSSISPGYENGIDGIKKFQKEYMEVPKDLIINEVMNSNYEYLPQNGGEYYDWIELYNNSKDTIKLSDYCITTNINTLCRYKLEDKELKSGEYYILMASGEENLSNDSYKHAPFKISDTESLYITKSNKIIDSLFIANVPKGYSYGRNTSTGAYYFSKPTPGKKNQNGSEAVSYKVTSSLKSGIYNNVDKKEVALSGSGKIYYTLDGSNPTKSSKVYSSPLSIEKTTVLKVRSYENDKIESEISTYSYIINENHKINVMSLVIDPKDFNTLNTNAWKEALRKKCHIDYLSETEEGFSIDAGLKLFGGSTRGHAKKSYEIKFQKEYGPGSLKYKVFDTVNSSVFNSLVLRTGSQDEMGTASKKTLIRDIVGTSLVDEYTNVDVQAYKPVAMYINGKYWGLYFIREKVDETFVSNHYNVEISKTDTDLLRIDGQIKSGSNKKYNNMINFITSNSLDKTENYNKIKDQINIKDYCDFWIAETWTANNDIVNCRFFSNPNVDNGKWHFIFYDLDYAFYNVNKNYYEFSTNPSGMTVNGYSTVLLRNMMKSKEFRETYLERLSYNLNNTWKSENVIKKIDSIIEEITVDEIKRNLDRWNMSYKDWQSNINFLKDYAYKRGSYMKSYAKSYFKLSNAEYKKYFGE